MQLICIEQGLNINFFYIQTYDDTIEIYTVKT